MKDEHPTRRPPRGASPAGRDQRRQPTSLRFGSVAAALAEVARAERLVCPAFRSPPSLVGVSRSIRRRRDGMATVAVALRGRPWAAVLADMVEGVVAANRLRGVAADRCRARLWAGIEAIGEGSDARADLPVEDGSGKVRAAKVQADRKVPKPSKREKAQGFAA